ncbi:MAG: hypothetical protein ACXABY_28335 [Candidatus Thorarchaeota archaeon]|jgi:hypothetical protein
MGRTWTDDELKALRVCVKAGRVDSDTLGQVFPYRSPNGVRHKLRALQKEDRKKWTPPPPEPPINWQLIEILEAECEESESSEICMEEVPSV